MTFDPGDAAREGGKDPGAFRTISEVAEELGLPQHVLRFWETRFPQIKPIKRGGGRRYYRPNDVDLLRGIKQLLYGEGYTIRGVQRILREQGGRKAAILAAAGGSAETDASAGPGASYGLAGGAAGPEVWAPRGKRETPRPDPVPEEQTYSEDTEEDDGPSSAPVSVSPVPPAPVSPGLSPEQIARLTAALQELRACRRLLDQRS
ncbi:MerR family transcriptional regulator [Hansschlegelia beijingensis]|uniref:MerR family transcriptional regulator n=1 Tax=Hansschlegelia beijingensis TaxID=1133344 RepID=UPI00387EFAB4